MFGIKSMAVSPSKTGKVVQISQGKTEYILWDKKGNCVNIPRTKKLDAAFQIGMWELFHKEYEKGEKND